MSTRGIFIIRKNGIDKSLYIASDAYPQYSARNVVSLIRDSDLDKVYDILIPSEFSQYYWFDAEALIAHAKENRELHYKDNQEFIMDSLMCEYGYVINIDEEELEFYVGFQKEAQAGNRYGEKVTYTTSQGENYYPCKMVARFSFRYVKSALMRAVQEAMEKAGENDVIAYFDVNQDEDLGGKGESIEPSPFLIYKKLEFISEQISSTLDKHIDIQSRFEQGLRDIDKIKMEMMVYRMEIADLQMKINGITRER